MDMITIKMIQLKVSNSHYHPKQTAETVQYGGANLRNGAKVKAWVRL